MPCPLWCLSLLVVAGCACGTDQTAVKQSEGSPGTGGVAGRSGGVAGGTSGVGGSDGSGRTMVDPCWVFVPCTSCGNGRLDREEACDDGNLSPGDGCTSLCQVEEGFDCPYPGTPCRKVSYCGDGVVDSDEPCDDGNGDDRDGCSADCQAIELGFYCPVPGSTCKPMKPTSVVQAEPKCGDGILQTGEACDDGIRNDDGAYGGCTTRCELGPYCGDGLLAIDEECDLGRENGSRGGVLGCSTACKPGPYCGDGKVDRGEECDMGERNGQQHSDCSTTCKLVESSYSCRCP